MARGVLAPLCIAVLTAVSSLCGTAVAQGHEAPVPPVAAAGVVAPKRVVSINLCTDQLAMMLAAPGQLHSVSYLSADPRGSAMAEAAQGYALNHARAEEIWLMQPDLVVAGSFSSRATVDMLKRLGVPVAVMEPAYGLSDIPARLREMGAALGREAEAEKAARDFETRLSMLSAEVADQPRAALYFANGYTSGDKTLAGEILAAAGFANVAAEVGLPSGGHMPLEVLAMAEPDAVITGRRYPGASRSEAVMAHPVIRILQHETTGASLTDRDWICGTPHVLRAIEGMRDLRLRMGRS
jgi:iron complex transport system substrate-binding protein